jgi:hypothetical protein
MLAAAPRLTAAQICGIKQRTAQPLPGRNFEWADDSGYGVVNGAECFAEAVHIDERRKLNE